ncbi:MAG: SpoIIE family protein phosphatase [Pseudomonadales bacterium]|nr:SpoIIE family protein phosphatase [Pseudomonadales bacterium]
MKIKKNSFNTILIVDDISSNRVLLRKMLTHLGFETIEATNGQEAIELFRTSSPDLILMDINMPVMNGYEASTAIKAMAGENHVPIIFVTALSANLSLTEALQSGGDDYVNKPIDLRILESKIAAHLRIRELNQKILNHNQELLYEQETIEHFFNKALSQSHLDPRYINYHLSPMSAFNGDILLAEKGPNGSLYLMLGDFTGHGLRAAMGTLPVTQTFFPLAQQGTSIGDIAAQLNQQLLDVMPVDMFCAATLVELDQTGKRLTIWAGGMPDLYWVDPTGELKGTIHSQHMPLGILPDQQFNRSSETLFPEEGDQLYLYSDGIIEAGVLDGKPYGESRLKDQLTSPKQNRFERVLTDISAFRDGREQEDDITLVELTCDARTAPPRIDGTTTDTIDSENSTIPIS